MPTKSYLFFSLDEIKDVADMIESIDKSEFGGKEFDINLLLSKIRFSPSDACVHILDLLEAINYSIGIKLYDGKFR